MTDARGSRFALSVLSRPTPEARASRFALSVLVRQNAATTGPAIYWWDGSALQEVDIEASGWWDGIAIQDIDWTASGWWDGDSIEALET